MEWFCIYHEELTRKGSCRDATHLISNTTQLCNVKYSILYLLLFKVSEHDIKEMFNTADTDRDGKIR